MQQKSRRPLTHLPTPFAASGIHPRSRSHFIVDFTLKNLERDFRIRKHAANSAARDKKCAGSCQGAEVNEYT